MRLQLLSITLTMLVATATAQSIQWMHDAGSTPFSANERGDAVDTDADGNVYVLGHLSIDSQFSGLPVPAAQDGCVAKYNADGVVQWVRTFGGPGFVDVQETGVKVSSVDGAVYVCGSFRTQFANPTVSFDGIAFTFEGNSRHAFLAKYDLDGSIQWMRHGGGEGLGAGFNDLDIDDQGRVVVVGTANGANVFAGETLTYDGGILVRYLPDGTLADLIQLNNASAEHQEATAVEVAPGSGNIFVGGAFFGSIALGSFSASATPFSIYVMKLDDGFACQWISAGGGDNSTYGSYLHGLAIDGSENVYITGDASGEIVTFGTISYTGHTPFDDEVITVKFDASGTPQWLRHGGSERNDEGFDIIADSQGSTVITGLLGGNIPFAEFDGIQVDIVSQSAHCFIARYDPDGAIIYAERMGGGSDDVGSGLGLANDSTFYLTGTTWGSTAWLDWNFQSCCLDPNLFIAKVEDAFNDLSTAVRETTRSEISVMPNPANDRVTITGLPSFATLIIFNANGQQMPQPIEAGSFDVVQLPNGVYQLRTQIGRASHTARLVVHH